AYAGVVLVNAASATATGMGSFHIIGLFLGNKNSGNTLTGPDVNSNWTLSSLNAGTLSSGIAFSNFPNLVGGIKSDTFYLNHGAGVTGSIDGGSGTNALDYSTYTTGVTVNLGLGTATGTAGIVHF